MTGNGHYRLLLAGDDDHRALSARSVAYIAAAAARVAALLTAADPDEPRLPGIL